MRRCARKTRWLAADCIAPIWVGPATREEDLSHSRTRPTRSRGDLLMGERRGSAVPHLITLAVGHQGRSTPPTVIASQ